MRIFYTFKSFRYLTGLVVKMVWTASMMGKKGGRSRSPRKLAAIRRNAKLAGFPVGNARCLYCGARLSVYSEIGRCYRYPCRKAHALAMKEADTGAKSTLSPQS